MGIGAFVKSLAPTSIYVAGIVLALMAIAGRTQYPLLFVVCLMPLRNVVEKLHPYFLGQDFLDIMIVCILIGWFFRAMSNRERLLERSGLNGIIGTLMVYTYISLWVGYFYLDYYTPFDFSDPRLQDMKNFLFMPLYFFVAFNNFKDKTSIKKALLVMALAMFVVMVYTAKQVTWFRGIESRVKIAGTFVYLGPNEVAAFCNMYGVFLIALGLMIKEKWPKIIIGVLAFLCMYSIIFLFSRAAYAGVVAGLMVLFLLRARILLIPLILVLVFWQAVLPEQVIQRITMTVTESGELESSAATRITVWEESLNLFTQYPVFGVGFHVFRSLGFHAGDTHNIYLKILAEQGLVGIIIFLLMIFLFMLQSWRLYRNGDDEFARGVGLGLFCCLIVLLVNNLFGNRWTHKEISTFLWVLMAFVCRLLVIAGQAKETKPAPAPAPASPEPERAGPKDPERQPGRNSLRRYGY